ncbi:cystathionine beta-lyase-like protein [Protomyces lactucae-debilis]|uniref:cysteine-S-conjugate beta-lyase n=1 Tax=Protomyces lactucae-debilis TaxID=2754530 RepID=A0A1Y2FKA9_PROLT|nr:cystathionine beta-lyase-like protein [Protomyces lactucae-debilis]ORY84390.1 cystathionine beta-lyase-like protein [Protomyces lactucae-debilis]
MGKERTFALATELVHFNNGPSRQDPFMPSVAPLYQSATFKQVSATQMGDYDYTRSGNPTRTQLEAHMCKVFKTKHTLAINSGMGAMDVIIRLLKPGDQVVAGDDLYGGTNRLLGYLKQNAGVDVRHVDTTSVEAVQQACSSKTTMVFLETPTNPLLKIADLPALAAAAKKANPEVIVVVDNTVMSPLLQQPLTLGCDIHYESATKYLNGHHDVMAGIIAVNDEALYKRLFFVVNATGCGIAPFDAWLLMRGVKTLGIRLERAMQTAGKLAIWLEEHLPRLLKSQCKVNYPGLASHPQYAIHSRIAKGGGAVLSFSTGSVALSEQIVSGTQIFGITVSFGSCDSLISMPCRMSHASIPEHVRRERQLPEDLIRLCVGIEDYDDLVWDLEQSILASVKHVEQHGAQAEGVNHPTQD